jgi:hypothetical protein
VGHALIRRHWAQVDEFVALRPAIDERTSYYNAMKEVWSARRMAMRSFQRHFLQTIVLPPSLSDEVDFHGSLAAIKP